MGAGKVCLMSRDDKARVPMAIPAVQRQDCLLMGVEYRLRFSSHDFPIAAVCVFVLCLCCACCLRLFVCSVIAVLFFRFCVCVHALRHRDTS